ncbi:MAG: LysM peptidoglycan-binding domain-containing protein [Anaerolineae bacterium]
MQPNTNVTGSVYARLKTCNIAPNADNCGSAVESGAFVRVGIDPNGGTDPNSPSIVWSGNIMPHDTWGQAVVSATSAGGSVTMFIYVTQAWPADLNRVWFDDASLSVGGAGGSVPGQPGQPTTTTGGDRVRRHRPADAPRWIDCPRGAAGRTMTGISTAYGVPIDTIVQLNGLRSSRYIFIGQELLIRPAGSAPQSTPVTQACRRAVSRRKTSPR